MSVPLRRWFSEPYRLLFPMGILLGWIGVGHWFSYGAGWSKAYSGYYHACVQGWLFTGAFVAGFLMTAIPRLSGAAPASILEGTCQAAWLAATLWALTQACWSLAVLGQLGFLITLALFIGRRLAARRAGSGVEPPREFVWIPAALACEAAGLALILAGQNGGPNGLILTGRVLVEQGFLLCLVMGVGGFLAPRLMGTVRERSARTKGIVHLASAGLLAVSFYLDATRQLPAAGALRALTVTVNLWFTGALVLGRPSQPGPFPRLVWTSFWMIAAGLWLSAIFPVHRVTMLHFLFIGGFSLMIYSIATMVVLSHAGHGPDVYRPRWIYYAIGSGHGAALALRLSAGLDPERYFTLLAAASAVWFVTGAAWLVFAWPYLFRMPDARVVEEQHEEFRRLARHAC